MTLPTQLHDALRSLSPLEAVAVVTGVAYILLIMRRSRWGCMMCPSVWPT